MDHALRLRQQVLASQSCSFDVQIVADYGDVVHSFSLRCMADGAGGLAFTVTAPESICGITGSVDKTGGKLTFDDVALAFPVLAEKLPSPVSGPWVFYNGLRSGYIASVGADGNHTRVRIHDNYGDNALQLDLWLDGQQCPVQADVIWENRRILTMQIRNFQIV